jgi:hypothetical protein
MPMSMALYRPDVNGFAGCRADLSEGHRTGPPIPLGLSTSQ